MAGITALAGGEGRCKASTWKRTSSTAQMKCAVLKPVLGDQKTHAARIVSIGEAQTEPTRTNPANTGNLLAPSSKA